MAERSPASSWNSRSSRSAQAQAVSDRTAPSSQLSDPTSTSTSNYNRYSHDRFFSNATSFSSNAAVASIPQPSSSTTSYAFQSTRPLANANAATAPNHHSRAAPGAPAPAHTLSANRQAPSSFNSLPTIDSNKSRYIPHIINTAAQVVTALDRTFSVVHYTGRPQAG